MEKYKTARVVMYMTEKEVKENLLENNITALKVTRVITTIIRKKGSTAKIPMAMVILQLEKTAVTKIIYQIQTVGSSRVKVET